MGGDYEQRDKAEKQGDKVEQLDRGINTNIFGGFINTGGQPSGYPYPGEYAPPGYPASDYIPSAHSPTVHASSYSTGYTSSGYTPAPYPTVYPSAYTPSGYNPAVYPPSGHNPAVYTSTVYNSAVYPHSGYNPAVYTPTVYNSAVYPPAPPQGPSGCPPPGYPPQCPSVHPLQGAFAAGGSGAAAYNVRDAFVKDENYGDGKTGKFNK